MLVTAPSPMDLLIPRTMRPVSTHLQIATRWRQTLGSEPMWVSPRARQVLPPDFRCNHPANACLCFCGRIFSDLSAEDLGTTRAPRHVDFISSSISTRTWKEMASAESAEVHRMSRMHAFQDGGHGEGLLWKFTTTCSEDANSNAETDIQ